MLKRIAFSALLVAAAFVAAHAFAGLYGVAFVLGLVVMDAAWAFKLGIPQAMWHAWKHRNDPPPVVEWGDELDWDEQDHTRF